MKNFLLLFVLIPAGLAGQVWDDFSDGDFTSDPAWYGDLAGFKLSTSTSVPEDQRPALQLDAPAAGIFHLALDQHLSGDLEWQFWVKLSFNTSSGNFARAYLLSDSPDPEGPLNGYFLQVGGSDDSVCFYRQDSLALSSLGVLKSVYTGNSTNTLRFRITRSPSGDWKFYGDVAGGHSPVILGEINDLTTPGGDCFIAYCQCTSSNTTKFYFDDFYAGPLIIDSIPPVLTAIDTPNSTMIRLTFSEPVDPVTAQDTATYFLDQGIGNPYAAVRQADAAVVYLFLPQEMESGRSYSLTLSPVKDLAGNGSEQATFPLIYYETAPYDLIFTEIMADPSPPVDLPEFEYLELYNRSDFPLNLDEFILEISASTYELPPYSLDAGGFLLLCDEDAVEFMQHTAPSAGLSSFNLPNSGAALHMKDTAGSTICHVSYELSWHTDDVKQDGGWALEMIDTENPCKAAENWSASVAAEGGTPGKPNSVSSSPGDPIRILGSCLVSEQELRVEFSEALDSLRAADTSLYSANPYVGPPISAVPIAPDFRYVSLIFNESFSTGQIYRLTVNPGLVNCIGTGSETGLESSFAPAVPVGVNDIIINEVLFNPSGDGVDYVEIYNRSGKAVDLDELILASVKESPPNPPDTQMVPLVFSCHTLLPDSYLVLTSDPGMVKSQFYTGDPGAFLEMSSFPSFNNDIGYVLLMNNEGMKIDGMGYTEGMHYLMLLSFDGVALERISHDRPGDEATNWHSAAETSGFGTPGYQNSQFLDMDFETGNTLSVRPEIFSPDSDGIDDNLGIAYTFNSPGKLVTVLIFSSEGRLVRTLVNNELPGTHGVYSWDGTLDDRTPAPDGIYVVYMEALGTDGKMSRFKKAGVLARRR